MELNLSNADGVDGHGKMVAAVVLIFHDYKTMTKDDLKSADVENDIIKRLADAALDFITSGPAPEVRDTIGTVYRQFRIGSPNVGENLQLFFRPLNVLGLAFSTIEAVISKHGTQDRGPHAEPVSPGLQASTQADQGSIPSSGLAAALKKGGGKGKAK